MLKKIYGSAVFGVEAHTITIEVNVDYGIGYHLVGLPDNAIKESNFRIAAALQNNGYKIPGKKLIINMSPADMRKEGSAYDLPLAMGILAASNKIKEMHIESYIIMGELSLDGTVQSIKGVISIVSENCDVPNNTEQGFVYSTEIQPTLEDIQVNVNGTSISTTLEGLTPNTTYYVRSFLTNNLGDFYGNEMEFTTNESCDAVYLDENGVTIKACDDANIGDVGTINGVDYTVVDRAMLDQMIANNEDLTVVCTTRVTDMHFMFFDNEVFNQPIDNWDVSNVTDMSNMFETAIFNQPIGNWDVSSVTNMSYMFEHYSAFNQDIGNWDVSSVTNMSYMFSDHSAFNQPIGDWDVSNVTDMRYMFSYSAFNQDIGDWDVSSVTNMDFMFFFNSAFNQPIGDWDVSNVTSMGIMFSISSFNQPIGDWDVSNVTYMSNMFSENTSFNQDLSNWSVGNVTECSYFSSATPQWTLPQPNFTNCNTD